MELQKESVVDKMMQSNMFTFSVFAFLLVFTIVQPALATSTNNKTGNSTLTIPKNQTIHKVEQKTVKPKSAVSTNPCPCIVFRMDDIQAFYLTDVQIKVMDLFQKKNASLSVGVIGSELTVDKKITTYLKTALKSKNAKLDMANHGWKHEDFSSLKLSQQVTLMNKTNQELLKTFGKKPDVFITPYNMYNNDTIKAIKQLKMKEISSGIWQEDKFFTTLGKVVANKDSLGLYHVPAMTDFQVDIGNESYWTSIPKDKIIASIDSHISKYGYDVFLIHPQNFAVVVNGEYANTVDKQYLDELSSIIDYAKSKHIKITTLSDIIGFDPANAKQVKVQKTANKTITHTTKSNTNKTTTSKASQYFSTMLPPKTSPHVAPNGSLTMNIKYPSGDRVGAYETSLKVYQDFSPTPYMDIDTISENPYTIDSLPLYHQYKIVTYVGGMMESTNLATLDDADQDLDVLVPDGGSMLVSVFYSDGQTPIPHASVAIKSQDNVTRQTATTDPDGTASRFYLPPTSTIGNYYTIDAKVSNHLRFSSLPVTLQPGDANEIRLVAPWPPVVQNLVTVKVYNQTKLLNTHGPTYVVDMYDDKGSKASESQINIHGEAYFWSMKTGDYTFKVVNTVTDKVLGTMTTTLDGTKNNYDIALQNNLPANKML